MLWQAWSRHLLTRRTGLREIDMKPRSCLLHHGADKTGELRHATLEKGLAELESTQDLIERGGVIVIGRIGKQGAGRCRPVLRCGPRG
jgi:hypothetical protein